MYVCMREIMVVRVITVPKMEVRMMMTTVKKGDGGCGDDDNYCQNSWKGNA